MAKYEAGFIGAGNMGGALALAAAKKTGGDRIAVACSTQERSEAAAQRLGCTAETPQRILSDSRFVFLGVKPQMVVGVVEGLKADILASEGIFVSMLAGVSLEKLALLLGADSAVGVDIDPNAVPTAYQNAEDNGIDRSRYTVLAGNVLDDHGFVDSLGKDYDIVVANIVAGVIVPLTDIVPRLLKKGGLYITSGIIAERAQEVIDAMQRNGFTVTYTENRKDWMVIVATR